MTSVLEYFIMTIKPKNGHVWYCEYLILQYWHPSVVQQTSSSCAQRTFRPPSHPRAQLFPHTQLFLLGCAHIIPPVSTIWSMTSLTAQHWLFSAALVSCCSSSCEFWTCVGVCSEPLAVSLSAGPDLTFISSAHAALMWAKMKDEMRAAMTSLWPLNPGEVIAAIFLQFNKSTWHQNDPSHDFIRQPQTTAQWPQALLNPTVSPSHRSLVGEQNWSFDFFLKRRDETSRTTQRKANDPTSSQTKIKPITLRPIGHVTLTHPDWIIAGDALNLVEVKLLCGKLFKVILRF